MLATLSMRRARGVGGEEEEEEEEEEIGNGPQLFVTTL